MFEIDEINENEIEESLNVGQRDSSVFFGRVERNATF